MTDYYPLIARAIAGLDKSTGEGRRALYERARTALVNQLRGLDPPLSESEITRERLGLEEAIRRVAAEAAKRPRTEASRAEQVASSGDDDGGDEPRQTATAASSSPRRRPPSGEPADSPAGAPAQQPTQPRTAGRSRAFAERAPLSDQGLKGFRDVVAEAENLGEATAQAAKSARQVFAAVPYSPDLDKVEPRVEPEG